MAKRKPKAESKKRRTNDGKPFEDLSEFALSSLLQTDSSVSVRRNVKLDGFDGKREIDLLIESAVGPFSITTVVECKDYKRPLGVEKVDGLHSKMMDVKANKAAFVTRRGFTKVAMAKARRLGIQLFLLDNSASPDWGWVNELPIVVQEIRISDVRFNVGFSTSRSAIGSRLTFNSESVIPGGIHGFAKRIQEMFLNEELPMTPGDEMNVDIVRNLGLKVALDCDGGEHPVTYCRLNYRLFDAYYFGNLKDIPDCISLKDIDKDVFHHTIPAEALFEKYRTFCKIQSLAHSPAKPVIYITAVLCPELNPKLVSFNELPITSPPPAPPS